MKRAHALVNRVADLLEELRRDLVMLEEPGEPARVEAEGILYERLLSAIEARLVRTMEDALTILRHESQPLGPMCDE
jgi:hypothetical protein